jgi:hypothetical protein
MRLELQFSADVQNQTITWGEFRAHPHASMSEADVIEAYGKIMSWVTANSVDYAYLVNGGYYIDFDTAPNGTICFDYTETYSYLNSTVTELDTSLTNIEYNRGWLGIDYQQG